MPNEALLGLATTKELLEEIEARGISESGYWEIGSSMAIGARNLMDSLPGSMLNYRTVDGNGDSDAQA